MHVVSFSGHEGIISHAEDKTTAQPLISEINPAKLVPLFHLRETEPVTIHFWNSPHIGRLRQFRVQRYFLSVNDFKTVRNSSASSHPISFAF